MARDILLGTTRRDWSIGDLADQPNVWTHSALHSEFLRIINIIDTVNLEVSRAATKKLVDDGEWKQWLQFYQLAHEFLTTASSKWGSNASVARGYEQEALKWRELVRSRGGQVFGPPKIGMHPEDKSWLSPTTAAIAIGGAASLALLISAIKK